MDPKKEKEQEKVKSGIEELEESLYSPKRANEPGTQRKEISEKDYDVEREWEEKAPSEEVEETEEKSRFGSTFFRKLFFASIGFFFVAIAIAGVVFFSGSNIVSNENIQIAVTGPTSVRGGDPNTFQIFIENENDVSLQYTDLVITFPAGTREAEDLSEVSVVRRGLGTIAPKGTRNEAHRVVFFGNENERKDISITLEYRLEGSNAIFTKEMGHVVQLSSAPIVLNTNLLREAVPEQEVELEVEVRSNSESIIKDLTVDAEYPLGFEFTGSDPNPLATSNTVWDLGDLAPGEMRTIRIRGILHDEGSPDKIFRISAGAKGSEEDRVAISYADAELLTQLTKPFIDLDMVFGGRVEQGRFLREDRQVLGTLNWKNTLPDRITDLEIDLTLNGEIINRSTIGAGAGGFYRSSDDTLVWNRRTSDRLAVINSGQSGSVSFQFEPYARFSSRAAHLREPEIRLEATIRGKRISETGVPEELVTVLSRTIKVESDVQLSARGAYYSGPIVNSGPIPPKVGEETTYTIIWTILNSVNELSTSEVRAVLPTYVRWVGTVQPLTANISYNEHTGEVTWRPGRITPGTGVNRPVTEVAFQIAISPSLSQVDDAPELIRETHLVANDSFTGTVIQRTARAVSTELREPGFTRDMARVAE